MDVSFEDQRPVPLPSTPLPGERLIALPASVAAKVLLLNEMLAQKVIASDLARRMETTRQEVHRLIDLNHTTRIDRIEDALKALGRDLTLSVT